MNNQTQTSNKTSNRKAHFEVSDFGRCVTLTTPDGVIREFHIPYTRSGDGYIREGSNMSYQVCEKLEHSGAALMATDETLLSVIRREWRRRRNCAECAELGE